MTLNLASQHHSISNMIVWTVDGLLTCDFLLVVNSNLCPDSTTLLFKIQMYTYKEFKDYCPRTWHFNVIYNSAAVFSYVFSYYESIITHAVTVVVPHQ